MSQPGLPGLTRRVDCVLQGHIPGRFFHQPAPDQPGPRSTRRAGF